MLRQPSDQQSWLNRATLYELLAVWSRLPNRELSEAVSSGEFAAALAEVGTANELAEAPLAQAAELLSAYRKRDDDAGDKGGGATNSTGSRAGDEAGSDTCEGVPAPAGGVSDCVDSDGTRDDAEVLFHRLRVEYTRLFVGSPEPKVSPFAGVWWARSQNIPPLLFVNKRSMAVERALRSAGLGRPEGTNEPLDHLATMFEFLQYTALVCSGTLTAPPETELDVQTGERFWLEFLDDWLVPFAETLDEHAQEPLYRALAFVLKLL